MQGVANTHTTSHSEMFGRSDNVNDEVFLEWRVKAKNLIVKVGGEKSEHYKEFIKAMFQLTVVKNHKVLN